MSLTIETKLRGFDTIFSSDDYIISNRFLKNKAALSEVEPATLDIQVKISNHWIIRAIH